MLNFNSYGQSILQAHAKHGSCIVHQKTYECAPLLCLAKQPCCRASTDMQLSQQPLLAATIKQ